MDKVLHIISGLSDGGAEGVLYRMCKSDRAYLHIVISLTDQGKYGDLLEFEGTRVVCLNMKSGRVSLSGLVKLYLIVKKESPKIVQTWMYHADLIGGLVAKLAGAKAVFWNIRHTTLEPGKSKRSTIIVAKSCALLSKLIPKKIIYCAYEAQRVHEVIGYKKGKAVVIGNGYDLNTFQVCGRGTAEFRAEIDVPKNQLLFCMVGRYDPQKDHKNLIAALSVVAKRNYSFRLILVGRDLDKKNISLLDDIASHQLLSDVILLGQRTDIPTVMNSIDLHILSSSFGEGFPNVLAEAMACSTPCVTTNVGDAALIVGDAGWVVPPKDPQVLANAIIEAIDEKQKNNSAWLKRKEICRHRIIDNFSIQKMISNYHKVWSSK